MSIYTVDNSEFSALKGKNLILLGGATGIGRALVEFAAGYGANIALGDVNTKDSLELLEEVNAKSAGKVVFLRTDSSVWDDQVALFEFATKEFGELDGVLANAGIYEKGNIFDDVESGDGKLLPPDLATLNVNLVSQIYAAKLAVHYFSKKAQPGGSIVFTGSAASIIDTPPLHLYCASKAGTLGLMRSLRTQLIKQNVNVNMIAPWMTKTTMTPAALVEKWGDLPANEPVDVAKALLLPVIRPKINGKAFWVGGTKIVEIEDKLDETRPIWLTKDMSEALSRGQILMGIV